MFLYYEDCPICGNEISVPGKPGDVRKCQYCNNLYVVKYQNKNHKYLTEYQKQANKNKKKTAIH